jgi:hypothetical protein
MDDTQKMTKALLDFAEAYATENDLDSGDAIAAMAHAYVIYGFALKKDDATDQAMRDALVGFVTLSADHMMEATSEEA